MKLIPLTQGKFAQVDDEDYDKLIKYKWYANFDGHNYYAVRGIWNGRNMSKVRMHRQIMNPLKDQVVDHINHDTLNCQKINMRNCSIQENKFNTTSHHNSTSKYLGVHLYKKKYKNKIYFSWRAVIYINKKCTYIGSFKSEENAAIAYNDYAKKFFGEFANLNKL